MVQIQAQTGILKSTPKSCRILGDSKAKVIFKNVGNNHNYPLIWTEQVTMSGTSVTLCSGLDFHNFSVAKYGTFIISPLGDIGSGTRVYVSKNTTTDVVSIESTASIVCDFDVMVMLGTQPDMVDLRCRGDIMASVCGYRT